MGNNKGRRRRFGAVRQLPSGRYQARYPGPDGLIRTAPRTFDTETDANVWLTVTQAQLIKGDWLDPDAGRVPLGEYTAKWIAERPLARRTADKYSRLLRLHLAPTLGQLDLVEVTPERVRSWRAKLLDAGVGSSTVAQAYRLLRAVMNTAADDELIRRNPCRIKGADRDDAEERPIASVAQVFAIAGAIRPQYRTLVLLAAFTGLRWGELLALTRRDLDMEAATVRVSASMIEVGDALSLGPPKSRAGQRTVAFPRQLLGELATHIEKHAERGPRGRVFVGPKGATPRRTNFNRAWHRAVAKAGVEGLRFHDLRHTANTMAAPGSSTRELMRRMGHASTRAAMIYQHASDDRDRLIADTLGTAIDQWHAQGDGGPAGDPALE
jgi:integrase